MHSTTPSIETESKASVSVEISVPKIIHTIWFGHKKLPDSHIDNILEWMFANPDFEVYLWVDRVWTSASIIQQYPDRLIQAAKKLEQSKAKSQQTSSTQSASSSGVSSGIEVSSRLSGTSGLCSVVSSSSAMVADTSNSASLSSSSMSSSSASGTNSLIQTSAASLSYSSSLALFDGLSVSISEKKPLTIIASDSNESDITFCDPDGDTVEIEKVSEKKCEEVPFERRVQAQLKMMDVNDHPCFTRRVFDGRKVMDDDQKETYVGRRVIDSIHHKIAKPRSNPASASDEARIVALREFGGMYLDCGDIFPGSQSLGGYPYFQKKLTKHVFCFRQSTESLCNDVIICSQKNPVADKIQASFFLEDMCEFPDMFRILERQQIVDKWRYLFLSGYDPKLNQEGTIATTGPRILMEACQMMSSADMCVDPTLYRLPKKQALSWLTFMFEHPLMSTARDSRLSEALRRALFSIQYELMNGYFRPNVHIHGVVKSALGRDSLDPTEQKDIEMKLMQGLCETKADFRQVKVVQLFSEFSNAHGGSGIEVCKRNLPNAYRLAFPSARDLMHMSEKERLMMKLLLENVSIPLTSILNCFQVEPKAVYYHEAKKNGLWLMKMGIGYIRLFIDHINAELMENGSDWKSLIVLQTYIDSVNEVCERFGKTIGRYLSDSTPEEKAYKVGATKTLMHFGSMNQHLKKYMHQSRTDNSTICTIS